jgi:predicted TPR repeat methyltransferase
MGFSVMKISEGFVHNGRIVEDTYLLYNPCMEDLLQQALKHHKAGDYSQALQLYHQALQQDPSSVLVHYNLGLLFMSRGEFKYAVMQFNNVLSLLPCHVPVLQKLGDCYLQLDNLPEAQKAYTLYLQNVPEDVDTLNNCGVVHLKQHQAQLAADFFSRALLLDTHRQDIRANLAATFMQHDRYEQAIVHYHELLQHTADLTAEYNIAVAYAALGKFNEAIQHYQILLQKAPNAVAASNLGAVYLQLEQRELALNYFNQARALDPSLSIPQYLAAALSGEPCAEAPPEYVKNLFDQYAYHYDSHLQHSLNYQLPQQIRTLLQALPETPSKPWRVLDLGCGTGLLGQLLQDGESDWVGVDISPKMLAQARAKNCYQQLIEGDLREVLTALTDSFDIIMASDVFSYLGDLTRTLEACYLRLKPKGILILSIETHSHPGYSLQPTGRFAYSLELLATYCEQLHFQSCYSAPHTIRTQASKPVTAQLLVWQRS